jgi:hypothetical protein
VKILVIQKPDNTCCFLYPDELNRTPGLDDQAWLAQEYTRLLEATPEYKNYTYSWVDSANLPDKKYQKAIEWNDQGLYVNTQKFTTLSAVPTFAHRLLNVKSAAFIESDMCDLELAGSGMLVIDAQNDTERSLYSAWYHVTETDVRMDTLKQSTSRLFSLSFSTVTEKTHASQQVVLIKDQPCTLEVYILECA